MDTAPELRDERVLRTRPASFFATIIDELRHRFTHHPPSSEQVKTYQRIRQDALSLAENITALCPDSQERATAIQKIEEAVFWANASVARRS